MLNILPIIRSEDKMWHVSYHCTLSIKMEWDHFQPNIERMQNIMLTCFSDVRQTKYITTMVRAYFETTLIASSVLWG